VTFIYADSRRIKQQDTVTKLLVTGTATMKYRETYTYDSADRSTGMTQYAGAGTTIVQQVTYLYDELNRLKVVQRYGFNSGSTQKVPTSRSPKFELTASQKSITAIRYDPFVYYEKRFLSFRK
jgi:YD repeat-containing protein